MAAIAALRRIGVEPPKQDIEPEAMEEAFDSKYGQKEDLYHTWKSLEEQLEFIHIQVILFIFFFILAQKQEIGCILKLYFLKTRYVKDEMKHLRNELLRAQEEIKRIQSTPLQIGQFLEMVDETHAIVGSTNGSNYYTRVLSTLNKEDLKASASVALHRHAHSVVDILPPEADSTVNQLAMSEKPKVTYADIGGLDIQKQELLEAVELPLTHFHLYQQIGIDPPRGVLLWGPPGTGKTMMAKAVANNTEASFIRFVCFVCLFV